MNAILCTSHNGHVELGTIPHLFADGRWVLQDHRVKICIICLIPPSVHLRTFLFCWDCSLIEAHGRLFLPGPASPSTSTGLLSKLPAGSEATVRLFPFQPPSPTTIPPSPRTCSCAHTQTSYPRRYSPGKAHSSHYTPALKSLYTQKDPGNEQIILTPRKRVQKILGSSVCF